MTATEQALANARASVEMEGFRLSEEDMRLCKNVLQGDMSYTDFLSEVKRQAGVAI